MLWRAVEGVDKEGRSLGDQASPTVMNERQCLPERRRAPLQALKSVPQGLKPSMATPDAARLKSCPDTKHESRGPENSRVPRI